MVVEGADGGRAEVGQQIDAWGSVRRVGAPDTGSAGRCQLEVLRHMAGLGWGEGVLMLQVLGEVSSEGVGCHWCGCARG